MNQLLLMGMLHGLGNLTKQCQPVLHTELGSVLLYEVVQPNGIRIVLKDQCCAALVVLTPARGANRGGESLQDLELALGSLESSPDQTERRPAGMG